MVDRNVDEQAVNGELSAIRSLMTAVVAAMTSNTWQGGAAGHFISELQAACSSLAVMMAEVCQDVAAVNKKPFGPPPAMLRVQQLWRRCP
jgi:hypothetical protein